MAVRCRLLRLGACAHQGERDKGERAVGGTGAGSPQLGSGVVNVSGMTYQGLEILFD